MTTTSASKNKYYPWQQVAWQQIMQQHWRQKLGHAFIIHAPAGSGKLEFAKLLSKDLMCDATDAKLAESNNSKSAETANTKSAETANTKLAETANTKSAESTNSKSAENACGRCNNCLLLDAETHPDYFILQAENPGQQIKVEQIRQLNRKMQQTRTHGRYLIAIINTLDDLNSAAANGLLKQLEEPTPGTVFLLLLKSLSSVPATILSRCQKIRLQTYDANSLKWLQEKLGISSSEAEQLLQAASGGALYAQQLAGKNILAQRKEFISALSQQNLDYKQIADQVSIYFAAGNDECRLWLQTWIAICHQLVIQATGGTSSWLQQYPATNTLSGAVDLNNLMQLFDFAKSLQQALQYINNSINKQLLGEDLWLKWQQIFSKK